jgi:hypothetical protein
MAVSTVACPVIRMTPTAGAIERDRSSTSSPLIPGITRSATMRSNACSSMRVRASFPLPAVATQ